MMIRTWIASIFIAGSGLLSPSTINNCPFFCRPKEDQFLHDSAPFNKLVVEREALMSNHNSVNFGLRELNDNEIHSAIVGKTISPDLSISQSSLDFSETFHRDGRWISVRKMRGPVQIEGQWFVKNDKICVIIRDDRAMCRKIWKSTSSGYLYTSDLNSSSKSKKIIQINIH